MLFEFIRQNSKNARNVDKFNKTQDLVLSGNISLTYKTNAHSEITFEGGGGV